jgi:glycosyltransferase involved in cell wall biosynthesis
MKEKLRKRCLLVAEGYGNTLWIMERLAREVFERVECVLMGELPQHDLREAYLLFIRTSHPIWRWIAHYCHEHGIEYDYFIDDNFFEIKLSNDPHNGPLFDHPATHETIAAYLQFARQTIVMSEHFASYLRARFPTAKIQCMPAPVDLDLFDNTRAAVATIPTEEFRVGYVVTARAWLADIINAVVEESEERFGNNVIFEFLGWWPAKIAIARNVRTFVTIWDYKKYAAFVFERQWKLGLAVLGDTEFENGKTNNKYREYGAARIPALYSDVPLYRHCVRHDQTGWLLPNSPRAWVDLIESLRDDSARRDRVATAARLDVETIHGHTVVATAFARVVAASRDLA